MSETDNQPNETLAKRVLRTARTARLKTTKVLPTDRVNVTNQLAILRAAAAISGKDRRPASNEEVSKVVNMHYGTVSNCNPFLLDTGLLTRHKAGNVPCEEVFAYADRFKWDGDKAAIKLAPVIRRAWFCATLLPKLSFRPLTITEAISFLAEESGATPDFKDQLLLLLHYMRAAGIISIDGANVTIIDDAVQDEILEEGHIDASAKPNAQSAEVGGNDTKSVDGIEKHHPFITGLLKALPEPETEWSMAARVKWLQTAANIFGLMYTTKDNADVEFIEVTKHAL